MLLITRDSDHLLDRVVAAGKRPTIVDLRGQNHMVKRVLEAKKRSKAAAKQESKTPDLLARRMAVPLKEQGGNGKPKQICKA